MAPKSKSQSKESTKTPQKTKAESKAAATSSKTSKQTPQKEDVKKEAAKPATPKKPAVKFTKLARNTNVTLPIDVTFQGDITEAKQTKSTYSHSLKLDSTAKFALVNTYVIPDGQELEGHQIIILKPAPAFKFMKLPVEVRARVYEFYFFTKGQQAQPITLDGKRKNDSKDPYAKTFAEGSKNRCAILAASKEVNKEATPALYSRPLRFDTPATLMTFFAGLDTNLRIHLRHIEIRQYVKKDAKTALAFLAEAKNLKRLRIEAGVATDADVTKTAKNFWADACKLLEVVGSRMEKEMVPIDDPKRKIAKKEESSDDEDDEPGDDDDDEDESEDSGSDQEDEEATDESKGSESKDASSEIAASEAAKDVGTDGITSDATAADATVVDAPAAIAEDANAVVVDTNTPQETNGTTATATDTNVSDGLKIEDGQMASLLGMESTLGSKKDFKSPNPNASTATKKSTRTEKEKSKMRQGRKNDATRILDFGRVAFKYKNKNKDKEDLIWTEAMEAKFIAELKAKLK